ncbi:hypothetical protein ACF3NT_11270 [Naumannella halotolerans]|uniref:hypothetical protein n=1 Tax=Naumannella halotolerans TaxID=993414 RepID=UPI00370DE0E4
MDFGKAKLIDEGNGLIVVATPTRGVDAGSNFTVAFDASSGEVVQTAEAHLKQTSESSGIAKMWKDGVSVVDKEFTNRDALNLGPTADGFIERLNRCLSNAGIPAWLLAAAAAGCGLGPAAAKIACIVALGIGAGTASYWVRYALDDN